MKAILTYHSLDDSGSPISVSPRVFREHVRWLASGAVTVLPLDRLVDARDDTDAIAITFDDGVTNLESIAAPLLRDHSIPATVFVVSGRTGKTNAWSGRGDPGIPELSLLDWDGLGRLRESGIQLGSHTRTHARLGHMDCAELESEIAGSADDIERAIGARPTTFAYPYGSTSVQATKYVRRCYSLACTTLLSPTRSDDDRALLPRLDCYYLRNPGQLEAWGTARFAGRLRVRAAARWVRGAIRTAGKA